ncbi:MAG: T9SS type A sorting domain-containing protein [Candidatus Marinimicrobia bacterium]|nr:T9SS type A sorting domain-containing protein [Candidatus Neomarinimicrobiota bacterium]
MNSKKLLQALLLFVMLISVGLSQDPIISIYYIGTRESPVYNHYLEIYNPTDQIIDLSQYAIIKGHGQSDATGYGWGNEAPNSGVSFYRLAGTLFPGGSFGMSRDVSHASLQNISDVVFEDECVLAISGDDAVGLFKGAGTTAGQVLAACDSIPIDAVGSPYEDPGQSWQVSGVTGPPNSTGTSFYGVTRFAILLRKPDVCAGNAGDWDSSRGCIADTCDNNSSTTDYESSEWEVIACHYPNYAGTSGPGVEPQSNPDCAADIDSMATFTNICDLLGIEETFVPGDLKLAGNYPNPFNPSTSINFSTGSTQKITVRIYNSAGQEVRSLFYGALPAGDYHFDWDATNDSGHVLSSGIYLVVIQSGAHSVSGKMMFLK